MIFFSNLQSFIPHTCKPPPVSILDVFELVDDLSGRLQRVVLVGRVHGQVGQVEEQRPGAVVGDDPLHRLLGEQVGRVVAELVTSDGHVTAQVVTPVRVLRGGEGTKVRGYGVN